MRGYEMFMKEIIFFFWVEVFKEIRELDFRLLCIVYKNKGKFMRKVSTKYRQKEKQSKGQIVF